MAIFFLFPHENICCGAHRIEASRGDASYEHHNICFHEEMREIAARITLLSRTMKIMNLLSGYEFLVSGDKRSSTTG